MKITVVLVYNFEVTVIHVIGNSELGFHDTVVMNTAMGYFDYNQSILYHMVRFKYGIGCTA